MIKYLANTHDGKIMTWGDNIETVEIEKETDKSVWIDGRRHPKKGLFDSYFDTWEEAKLFLTNIAGQELQEALRHVQECGENANKIMELKND